MKDITERFRDMAQARFRLVPPRPKKKITKSGRIVNKRSEPIEDDVLAELKILEELDGKWHGSQAPPGGVDGGR